MIPSFFVVYIAGASREIDTLETFTGELNASPAIDVRDGWMKAVRHEMTHGRTDRDLTTREREQYARNDLDDIASADMFWLVVPPAPVASVGPWVELGFALALRRPRIVISGDFARSIFCDVDGVRFDDHKKALRYIINFAEATP